MNREVFDFHVRTIESKAKLQPRLFLWNIALWVLIGFAGLFAWLAIILVTGGGLIILGLTLKLGDGFLALIVGTLILFFGGIGVLKVLWVSLGKPEGRHLKPAEIPELQNVLREMTRKLGAPMFQKIFVSPEFNASVCDYPRLGVFGWSRHYLMLGLPLMECLSKEEFQAVLAHECVHMSSRHGRFGNMIYRLRRSWSVIFENINRNPNGGLFRRGIVRFIGWYWPRFNARAFVLSRMNEYEADATAGRLLSPQALGDSLVRMDVYDRHLSEGFWKKIWKEANDQPQPSEDVLERLSVALRESLPEKKAAGWLLGTKLAPTTNADTHPSFSDRIQALGLTAPAFPPKPLQESAADVYFGSLLMTLRREMSAVWAKQIKDQWKTVHQRSQALKRHLGDLAQAQEKRFSTDADDLWAKASALLDLNESEAALPLLERVLEINPLHGPALFNLGGYWIEKGDETGVSHLEQAMKAHSSFVGPSCELLRVYHLRKGDLVRVKEMERRLDQLDDSLAISRGEQSLRTTQAHEWQAHALSSTQLDTLLTALRQFPEIYRAWLIQKVDGNGSNFFQLCIDSKRGWYSAFAGDRERTLAKRVFNAISLPGSVMVFAPTFDRRSEAKRTQSVEGACVYSL